MARAPESNFLKEQTDKNRKTIQENMEKDPSKKIKVRDPWGSDEMMDANDHLLDEPEKSTKGKATLDESKARFGGGKKKSGY